MKILLIFVAIVCALLCIKNYGAEPLFIQHVYSSVRGKNQRHEITDIKGRRFIFKNASIDAPITNTTFTIHGEYAFITIPSGKLIFKKHFRQDNVFLYTDSILKRLH